MGIKIYQFSDAFWHTILAYLFSAFTLCSAIVLLKRMFDLMMVFFFAMIAIRNLRLHGKNEELAQGKKVTECWPATVEARLCIYIWIWIFTRPMIRFFEKLLAGLTVHQNQMTVTTRILKTDSFISKNLCSIKMRNHTFANSCNTMKYLLQQCNCDRV